MNYFSIKIALISWLATTFAFAVAGGVVLEGKGFTFNTVVIGTLVYIVVVLPIFFVSGNYLFKNKLFRSLLIGVVGIVVAIGISDYLISLDIGKAVLNSQWVSLTLYFFGMMGACITYAGLFLFKDQMRRKHS